MLGYFSLGFDSGSLELIFSPIRKVLLPLLVVIDRLIDSVFDFLNAVRSRGLLPIRGRACVLSRMHRACSLLNRIARPILNHCYDPIRPTVSRQVSKRGLSVVRNLAELENIRFYRSGGKPNIFITAAFRSCVKNEAYLFMNNEYVVLNYAPGKHYDRVIIGPSCVSSGFQLFSEMGIHCAFGSHHGNQAFLFTDCMCARICYDPGTPYFHIEEERTIREMVPMLKGTVFEKHLDAAFESSTTDEAYLFKGNECARINYKDGRLISINPTFSCLKSTIFEDGIDAAFASHRTGEAYVFKKDWYARINFAHDYIIGGVKKILPYEWRSLNGIIPRTRCTIIPDENYMRFFDM